MHPPRVLTPRSNSSNMRLADFAPSTTTESASFSSAASSIYTQSFIKLAEERKIKGLSPVDSGKTGAINNHIPCPSDKVAVILLRPWHPETFIRCEQRPLHFVHGGRNLAG